MILNKYFNSKKLNFIVIGAQKAGTTALYHYLKKHPQIELPAIKELHFFDTNENFVEKKTSYFELHKNYKNFGKNGVK